MNQKIFFFFATMFAAVSLGACAPAPTPTSVPTAVPPTATRVSPTSTAVPPTATATVTPTAIPPTAIPPTATLTPKPVAIKVAQNATLGAILVDGDGRTLYLLTADNKSASVCNDDCVKTWPPFLSSTKAGAQEGVNASLIGALQRKDGSTQVAYNGWSLYYHVTDTKPGDTTGQGLDGVWFVVNPAGDPVKPASARPTFEPAYGR